MKYIRFLSPNANQLREKFQKQIIEPHIRKYGSLNGYNHQIYLLLPKFDGRLRFYRGVSKETYYELDSYLKTNQSQRRFNRYNYSNGLTAIRAFAVNDFSICYNRVWHNGTTTHLLEDNPKRDEHWKAQAAALYEGVVLYSFKFYSNDYNFPSRLYERMRTADPLLKSIYSKILAQRLGSKKYNF